MLNFAEQTGSGAVIVVWSFLRTSDELRTRDMSWVDYGLTPV